MQEIISKTCWFDYIDKDTGKEKRGKRVIFTMFLVLPSITNTGNYKITWYLNKNKYTVSVIKHKPGWIHDRRNPNPGQPWFMPDSDYSKLESIATHDAMLKWLQQHMGKEKGQTMMNAMEAAQPEKREKQEKSSTKTPTIAQESHKTINRSVCNWSSSTELLRV